jgi:hypothetical protein
MWTGLWTALGIALDCQQYQRVSASCVGMSPRHGVRSIATTIRRVTAQSHRRTLAGACGWTIDPPPVTSISAAAEAGPRKWVEGSPLVVGTQAGHFFQHCCRHAGLCFMCDTKERSQAAVDMRLTAWTNRHLFGIIVGMTQPNFKDLTGQRFGRWTVLSRADNAASGSAVWNCVCDCGTERRVLGVGLREGAALLAAAAANKSFSAVSVSVGSLPWRRSLEQGSRDGRRAATVAARPSCLPTVC